MRGYGEDSGKSGQRVEGEALGFGQIALLQIEGVEGSGVEFQGDGDVQEISASEPGLSRVPV